MSSVKLGSPNGMRGLVATKNIAEGDVIMEVPLAAAFEVSNNEASRKDPSAAALTLLRLYEEERVKEQQSPYFELLPRKGRESMVTMPDFFTDEELDLLQHPRAAEKTRRRRQLCEDKAREFGLPVEDVVWSLCMAAQRSFTVLSPVDGVLRLLLPGIDMMNHDADSIHHFKVRWNIHGLFDGSFKVYAGSDIKEGEEVRICYGGSPHRPDGCGGDCKGDVAWTNDQYLQKYGFVDTSIGSTIVDGRWLASEAGAEVREALSRTSSEEDEALLKDSSLSIAARTAIEFRLHMKRALVAQRQAQALLADTASAADLEFQEPKPHILPDAVKEQLRRAGVAYDNEATGPAADAEEQTAGGTATASADQTAS